MGRIVYNGLGMIMSGSLAGDIYKLLSELLRFVQELMQTTTGRNVYAAACGIAAGLLIVYFGMDLLSMTQRDIYSLEKFMLSMIKLTVSLIIVVNLYGVLMTGVQIGQGIMKIVSDNVTKLSTSVSEDGRVIEPVTLYLIDEASQTAAGSELGLGLATDTSYSGLATSSLWFEATIQQSNTYDNDDSMHSWADIKKLETILKLANDERIELTVPDGVNISMEDDEGLYREYTAIVGSYIDVKTGEVINSKHIKPEEGARLQMLGQQICAVQDALLQAQEDGGDPENLIYIEALKDSEDLKITPETWEQGDDWASKKDTIDTYYGKSSVDILRNLMLALKCGLLFLVRIFTRVYIYYVMVTKAALLVTRFLVAPVAVVNCFDGEMRSYGIRYIKILFAAVLEFALLVMMVAICDWFAIQSVGAVLSGVPLTLSNLDSQLSVTLLFQVIVAKAVAVGGMHMVSSIAADVMGTKPT